MGASSTSVRIFFRPLGKVASIFYSPVMQKEVEVPVSEQELRASPPVWLFDSRFRATIGLDSNIKITPLMKVATGIYVLKVSILNGSPEKENALATLLAHEREIGGAFVHTKVFNGEGTLIKPEPFPKTALKAEELMIHALKDNPLFVELQPGNPYYKFFIVFQRALVQFFGDMKDNYRGNATEVASFAFWDILNLQNIKAMSIGTSTLASE
jgi:hypothetical protein